MMKPPIYPFIIAHAEYFLNVDFGITMQDLTRVTAEDKYLFRCKRTSKCYKYSKYEIDRSLQNIAELFPSEIQIEYKTKKTFFGLFEVKYKEEYLKSNLFLRIKSGIDGESYTFLKSAPKQKVYEYLQENIIKYLV